MEHSTGNGAHETIGVVVVDDGRAFRLAARDVIAATPDFELLGEVASGREALAAADELHPDLVLLEVRLTGMDGIETSKRLSAAHAESVVVLVSVEDPLSLPAEVAACGAADVIRKQELRPALLRRIWRTYGQRAR
jgi:two-component system nitrate/nitrite response regulator NarL